MKPYVPLLTLLFLFSLWSCDLDQNRVDRTAGIEENYTGTQREIWQKPEMIIELFGDLSNKTAVDLGTGFGYFALFLANHAEKVLALDVNQDFVSRLDSIAQADSLNIEARLVKESDPLLEENEADAVIMCNIYMYLENRAAYLKTLRTGMSVGSKLIIVDFKKKQTRIGPSMEARLPLHLVVEELKKAGFIIREINDTALDYQYIVVAVNQ